MAIIPLANEADCTATTAEVSSEDLVTNADSDVVTNAAEHDAKWH